VLDALAGTLEPDVSVRWQRQPLEGFESRPLRTLADDFDLLVVDHPGLGEAVRDGALLPLDEVFSGPELAGWRSASVGASYDSYVLDGRPWALPLDAAAQVAVARPDLMGARPASWAQACQAAREHRTALCLGGPHALLMFSVICVAAGSPPARTGTGGRAWAGTAGRS
jgi:multiple sugar transport system substrate-binding protein